MRSTAALVSLTALLTLAGTSAWASRAVTEELPSTCCVTAGTSPRPSSTPSIFWS